MIDEMFPRILELGALGVINVLLVWKGVPALNELSKSNVVLANSIDKLAESVNNRLTLIERDLSEIKSTLQFIIRRLENDKSKI